MKLLNQTFLMLLLAVSLVLQSSPSHANTQAFAVDYLQGEGDVQGLKLAYQQQMPWLHTSAPN